MEKFNATATGPARTSGPDHDFQHHRYLDINLNGAYALWPRRRCAVFDSRENRGPSPVTRRHSPEFKPEPSGSTFASANDMTHEEIENCLNRALEALFDIDGYLFAVDSSERSISHRLAIHLAQQIPSYDVDCEYNRDGFDVKRLQLAQRQVNDDDIDAVTVFPDIIIHRRGTNDHNLLALEMKKGSSSVPPDYDMEKLKAFRRELKYKFAVHVTVGKNGAKKLVKKVVWVDGSPLGQQR